MRLDTKLTEKEGTSTGGRSRAFSEKKSYSREQDRAETTSRTSKADEL